MLRRTRTPGSIDAEAFATYRILLRKLADSGSQIVLLHPTAAIVDIANQVARPNLIAVGTYPFRGFPDVATHDHYSAYGYQSIARQFYARITGERDGRLTKLEIKDVAFEGSGVTAGDAPPLSSYDRIDVRLDDTPTGFISRADRQQRSDMPSDLKGSPVVALLAVKERGTELIHACFVPLEFPLPANAEVELKAGTRLQSARYALGRVRPIADGVNIGSVDIDGIDCVNQMRLLLRGNQTVSRAMAQQAGTVRIMVGDHVILEGSESSETVELVPTQGSLRRIHGGLAGAADIEQLPPSGSVNLVLEHSERGSTSVLIAKWTKTEVEMPHAERVLEKPLAMPSDNHTPESERR